MRRREFLTRTGAGVLGLPISGCCATSPVPPEWQGDIDGVAVDVHCHVFNAADLPVTSFILGTMLTEFLERYPALTSSATLLGDALKTLIASAAPNAETECQFLQGKLAPSGDPLAIWDRGAAGTLHDLSTSLPEGAMQAIETLLLWCRQLCDFRSRNIDYLFKLFGPERLGINVMTPTLVDFSRWLPDVSRGDVGDAPAVPIGDQVTLMEEIIRLRPGVHPFVAVDPLVEWKDTQALLDQCFNRDGVGNRGNGFVGVKLYPPLGYAPLENDHLGTFDPELPALVKERLVRLYRYCTDFDVPVMAHCNQSNLTVLGAEYGTARSEKWLPVLEQFPNLRLNLAHFGGPGDFADGKDEQQRTIGALMDGYPSVYSDFADEQHARDPAFRTRFVEALTQFVSVSKERGRRLMYGSDWSMLGMYVNHQTYFNDWYATFRQITMADTPDDAKARINGFFGGNALAFLGWRSATKSRERVLSFYRDTFGPSYLEGLRWLRMEGGAQ